MRPSATVAIVLIVLGILALSIHSFTYFTTQHEVGPLGFFAWDVSQPNTIFINPLAGLVAVGVGVALLLVAQRRRSI
ncbi:MAG TPA: hypothetical protein VMF30_16935 [Pirellulales bacterium]|nr:hypothetical protein [Pirellulales bacterium]